MASSLSIRSVLSPLPSQFLKTRLWGQPAGLLPEVPQFPRPQAAKTLLDIQQSAEKNYFSFPGTSFREGTV